MTEITKSPQEIVQRRQELLMLKQNILNAKNKVFEQADADPSFLEKNVLSGQLPMIGMALGSVTGGLLGGAAGGVGALPGTVAGAGLGGAAGQSIQDFLRSATGVEEPPKTFVESLQRGFPRAAETGVRAATVEAAIPAGGALVKGGARLAAKAPGIKQAIPFLKRGLQRGVRKIATPAFPQPVKEVAEAVATGQRTVGEEAAARGISGFKNKVFNLAKAKVSQFGSQLDDALRAADDELIDPREVVKRLEPVKQKFQRLGNKSALRQIERKEAQFIKDNIIDEDIFFVTPEGVAVAGQPSLKPSEANIIKRLHQRIAKFGASPFETTPVPREFSKALSRGIREEIEGVVPQASYLNKELHIYDEISDIVATSIARDLSRGGVSLPQTIFTGGGLAGGAVIGGGAGAVAGAGVAAAASKIPKSFPIRTFLASKLSKVAGGEATEGMAAELMAHPTMRDALFKAFSRIAGLEISRKKQR